MAVNMAVALRNAILNTIETTIGTSPVLEFRTGGKPTNIGDSNTGTVVSTLNLPSDWLAAASSGTKGLTGTWTDSSADATGTAGHWCLYASDGTTLFMRGTVTATGGGADITLSTVSIVAAGTVTITSFVFTAPNA